MKAYPCIGGPLNGHHARSDDFRSPRFAYELDAAHRITRTNRVEQAGGVHCLLQDDYIAYNRQNRFDKVPTMIWLHKDLLP